MRKSRGGQSLLEFTFVGIPMIFMLVSVFEISRGMWTYNTLAHAAKEGVRYAIVHGVNCGKNGNTCTVGLGPSTNACNNTNSTITEVIRCAGVGLDPAATTVSFTSASGTQGPYALNSSSIPSAQWPPAGDNLGGQAITIELRTPFISALAMLWPGSAPVRFTSGTLPASSSDLIQF